MNSPLLYMVAFWIASSAIRAMPDPQTNSTELYRWSFTFFHLLMANWDKVASAMPKAALATTPLLPPSSPDPAANPPALEPK